MKVYIPVVKYEVRTIDVNTDIPLSDDVKALEWLKANAPGWDDEGDANWMSY